MDGATSVRRALWVPLVWLAVMGAGSAPAHAFPPTPAMQADLAFAELWWGQQPEGCTTRTLVAVPQEVLGSNAGAAVYGRATQPEGSARGPCVMELASDVSIPACLAAEVVLHEYGHWLGYDHTDDATSIMHPQITGRLLCPSSADQNRRYLRGLRQALHRVNAKCERRLRTRAWCRGERYFYRWAIANVRRELASGRV